MSFVTGHRTLAVVLEAEEGVDPRGEGVTHIEQVPQMTPVPVEEPQTTSTPEFLEAKQTGAVAPGRKSTLVDMTHTHQGKISLYPVTVANNDSRPIHDLLLQVCGFDEPVFDGATPGVMRLIYSRSLVAVKKSLTLYDFHGHSEGGEGTLKYMNGLRGNATLSWGPKQDLSLSYQLEGSDGGEIPSNTPSGLTYVDSNGEAREAFSGLSARITTLKSLANAQGPEQVYDGCMTSGEIDFGIESARLAGIPVGAGKCPTRGTPRALKGKISIQKTRLSIFNPRAHMEAGTPLEIVPLFTARDVPDETLEIPGWWQILNVTDAEESGFEVWQLDIQGLWKHDGQAPGRTEDTTLQIIHTSPAP